MAGWRSERRGGVMRRTARPPVTPTTKPRRWARRSARALVPRSPSSATPTPSVSHALRRGTWRALSVPSAPKTAVEAPMDTWPPRTASRREHVPQDAGGERQPGGQRRAQSARDCAEEDAERHGVAGDVGQVGMQGQRGRGAPPLTLQHARGVCAPPLEESPRRAQSGRNGEGEDRQPYDQAGEGPAVVRSGEQVGSRRVLRLPGGEGRLRRGGVHVIDEERQAPVGSGLDLVRDAHGIEDHAPLHHGAVVASFAQQRHAAKVRGFGALVERRLEPSVERWRPGRV